MISSEKSGCMFRGQSFVHSSEVCEAQDCMICNEGVWDKRDEAFPPGVYETPSGLEEDPVMGCELDECELNGKFLSSGSVVCKRGDCGICFKGEWLPPNELK